MNSRSMKPSTSAWRSTARPAMTLSRSRIRIWEWLYRSIASRAVVSKPSNDLSNSVPRTLAAANSDPFEKREPDAPSPQVSCGALGRLNHSLWQFA